MAKNVPHPFSLCEKLCCFEAKNEDRGQNNGHNIIVITKQKINITISFINISPVVFLLKIRFWNAVAFAVLDDDDEFLKQQQYEAIIIISNIFISFLSTIPSNSPTQQHVVQSCVCMSSTTCSWPGKITTHILQKELTFATSTLSRLRPRRRPNPNPSCVALLGFCLLLHAVDSQHHRQGSRGQLQTLDAAACVVFTNNMQQSVPAFSHP